MVTVKAQQPGRAAPLERTCGARSCDSAGGTRWGDGQALEANRMKGKEQGSKQIVEPCGLCETALPKKIQ